MTQHAAPSMMLMLAGLNPAQPTGRDATGRPFFTVRARVPFTIGAGVLRDAIVRPASSTAAPVDTRAEAAGTDCAECEGKAAGYACEACGKTRAAPVAPAGGDGARGTKGPRIEGVASSTGRDSYGTEMSRDALDGMAAQFRSGSVVYLPQHPSWSGQGGEWDDVMGYVYDGNVERGEVADNTNTEEYSYILRVGVQLDEKHPKTAALVEKVADGQLIGQSIGGWFTKLTFVWPEGTDDDDKWWSVEPERIIVEEVDLDHLAATRRPANVESWIDGVRSELRAFCEHRAKDSRVRDAAKAIDEATRAQAAEDAPVVALAEPEPVAPAPLAAEGSEGSQAVALDTAVSTSDATNEPTTGSDALEALPAEMAALPSEQELSMTPAEIAALVAETVRATLAAEALRTAPAPAVVKTPEQIELEALRAEKATLQDDLRSALAAPARRGIVIGQYNTEPGSAEAENRVLLSQLDTESRGRRMGAVIRSKGFLDRRAETEGAGKVLKGSLEADLRALIAGACDDGLIRDPDMGASWA